MRLLTIAMLIGAAVVTANPLAEKLRREEPTENKTVIVENIVYECPKISPKVFIISMVSLRIFNW